MVRATFLCFDWPKVEIGRSFESVGRWIQYLICIVSRTITLTNPTFADQPLSGAGHGYMYYVVVRYGNS